MKKAYQYLLNLLLVIIAASLISYLSVEYRVKKIAMVDAVKLFNDYHMKKELELEAKQVLDNISHKSDSVENELKVFEKSQNTSKKNELVQYSNYYRSKYEEEYKKSNQIINEEVWKRLNPLISEYGKDKKYNLILGANGMGSVLYNDAYYDITDDILKYVNSKYDKGL